MMRSTNMTGSSNRYHNTGTVPYRTRYKIATGTGTLLRYLVEGVGDPR